MIPRTRAPCIVWDPLVRIFHWSLLVFYFLAYFLQADRLDLHSHAGNTVALLVGFRLVWGVIGARHARFSQFVAGPARALAYLRQLVRNQSKHYAGHNPAGAMMILMLLFSLLVTAFSGMFLLAMEGSGPLADTMVSPYISALPGLQVQKIHTFFADFILLLVILHVIGVVASSIRHGENLTLAMITGRKRLQHKQSDGTDGNEP